MAVRVKPLYILMGLGLTQQSYRSITVLDLLNYLILKPTTMLSFFFCLLRECLFGSPSLQTFFSSSFTFTLIATYSHCLLLFLSWLNAHFVHPVHYSRCSPPSFCLFSLLPPLSLLQHLHPPHFFFVAVAAL